MRVMGDNFGWRKYLNVDQVSMLSRVFSSSIFSELSTYGKSKQLTSIVNDSGVVFDRKIKLGEFFDACYECLTYLYKNEYVYKNYIANKILLGRHSLNTACMITEFRILNSKADVVIFNGTSHVYEIKTELDGLDRLEKQLSDYLSFSEYVSVVVSESHLDKIVKTLDPLVGVLVLTSRNTLSVYRKALSNINQVDSSVIFESLRMNEYCSIVESFEGSIPKVSNALMYNECKKVFSRMPKDRCHEFMVKVVKEKRTNCLKKQFIHTVPKSLKALAISSSFSRTQMKVLIDSLDDDFENYLV